MLLVELAGNARFAAMGFSQFVGVALGRAKSAHMMSSEGMTPPARKCRTCSEH